VTTSALIADFIPANPQHMDGPNTSIDLIVMHGTVSACVVGGARGNAHYFQNPKAGGAAHYVTDPGEIIGCVDEDTIAYHAPPNAHSLGIELCDWQGWGPDGDVDLWGDQPHQQMMNRAAALVREIGGRRGIALEWRTTDDLRAGRRNGITGHVCVAEAYGLTDHTDPGKWFPVDTFMGLVTGTPTQEEPVSQEPVFMAKFLDDPTNIWLVEAKTVAKPGQSRDDPTGRYGTRTRVTSPDVFWWLAGDGIPVRSGSVPGMGLYTEIS
jgi:hypothetical protein